MNTINEKIRDKLIFETMEKRIKNLWGLGNG